MALPPTIPTSFVPHTVSRPPQQFKADYGSAFQFFAYGVFVVVVALALGAFLYARILTGEKEDKVAALAQAERSISATTVESLVRLRDRLDISQNLLNNHRAFSEFFSTLDGLIPTSARLSSLSLEVGDGGAVTMEASGIARNFNVLANISNKFGSERRLKDAIFSDLAITQKNSVTFKIKAVVDPALLTFSAGAFATSTPPSVNATTTATSSRPTP